MSAISNSTANTLVVGTSSAESIINNNADKVTIRAGDGNDSLYNGYTKYSTVGFGSGTVQSYGGRYVIVDGEAGGDYIYVQDGNYSTLAGGSGNDTIINGTVAGGVIRTGASHITIDGGDDDDYVTNRAGNVSIFGGAGNDYIHHDDGEDVTIDGGAGNDTVHFYGMNIIVRGGEGNDSIAYNSYGYIYEYADGDGNDTINSYSRAINITKGKVSSSVVSGNNVILKIGAGSITVLNGKDQKINVVYGDYSEFWRDKNIRNSRSDTVISGGNMSDSIHNRSANVTINAGTGHDTILNENWNGSAWNAKTPDNVIINAGKGDDHIQNDDGSNTTLIGDDGDDYIFNRGSKSYITSGAGNDIILNSVHVVFSVNNENMGERKATSGSNSTIDGGAGNDSITNSTNDTSIFGGVGDDTIRNEIVTYLNLSTSDGVEFTGSGTTQYYGKNSTLNGGDGDDHIYNSVEKTTIVGGKGNDLISLGGSSRTSTIPTGKNYILYSTGEGKDTIYGLGSTDTIEIVDGSIDSSVVNGNDVLLNVGSGSMLLKNAKGKTLNVLQPVVTDLYIFNSNDNTLLVGGAGKDTIINHGKNVTINAGDNDDSIQSRNSNIIINGENGKDTISVYAFEQASTNVTINGGADDDKIYNRSYNGYKASHFVFNGDGGDDLIQNAFASYSSINGGEGNDLISNSADYTTIRGGAGNDTIRVSNKNDVVLYADGDGDDFVDQLSVSDTVKITSGTITTVDTTGSNPVVKIGNGSITFRYTKASNINIIDADGKKFDLTPTVEPDPSDTEDEWTIGSPDNPYIDYDAKKGKITVNDPFYGLVDAANFDPNKVSVIDASLDSQPVMLKAGNKAAVLTASEGGATLQGGDKVANDKLFGNVGNDVFVYKVGTGSDVIGNVKDTTTLYEGQDQIVVLGADRDDLIIKDNKKTANVTFKSDNKSKLTINKDDSLTAIEFYFGDNLDDALGSEPITYGLFDGVTLNAKGDAIGVESGMPYITVNAGDIISTAKTVDGSEADDLIHLIGNDNANVLIAGNNGSTLDGSYNRSTNKGTADKLYGGSDADIFIYRADGASDIIYGYDGKQGDKIMLLDLPDNYSLNKNALKDNGSSVVLSVGKGKLTINQPKNIVHFIDEDGNELFNYGVELPDGVTFDQKRTTLIIGSNADIADGTTFDIGDTIFADYAPNLKAIDASAYDGSLELIGVDGKTNALKASKGGSILQGGTGADVLTGNEGEDLFVYALGGGKDQILDFGDGDMIQVLGADSTTDISFVEGKKDLTIKIGTDTLVVKNYSSEVTLPIIGEYGNPLATYPVPKLNGLKIEKTKLTTTEEFNGLYEGEGEIENGGYAILRAADYSSAIKTIDASTVSDELWGLEIYGNENVKNVLRAPNVEGVDVYTELYGGALADSFYGSTVEGSGQVVFNYSKKGGKDTAYGYKSGDYIYLDDVSVDDVTITTKGKDIIISSDGNNSLTLKDTAYKEIVLFDSEDNERYYGYELPDGLEIKGAGIIVSNVSKANDNEVITLDLTDIDDYYPDVVNVDLSKTNVQSDVVGNDKNNILKAGTAYSAFYGGAGNDTFFYNTAEDVDANYHYTAGNDVIVNYDESKGIVEIDEEFSQAVLATVTNDNFIESGKDVILQLDKDNSITFKNAIGKYIVVNENNAFYTDRVSSLNGGTGYVIYDYSLPEGLAYDKTREAITVSNARAALNEGGFSIDLTNPEPNAYYQYAKTVKKVDLSKISADDDTGYEIIGNAFDNELRAPKTAGFTELDGGLGNDKLYGGNGPDSFYYTVGEGKDTIYNYDSCGELGDDIMLRNFDPSTDTMTFTDNKNVVTVVINGDTSNTLTISKHTVNDAITFLAETVISSSDSHSATVTSPFFVYGPDEGLLLNAKADSLRITDDAISDIDVTTINSNIKTINASGVSIYVEINGNGNDNVIYAGDGGSVLDGKGGNDKLYGSSNYDEFVYNVADGGKDSVFGYNAEDADLIQLNRAPTSVTADGKTIVLKFDNNNSLTINGSDVNGQKKKFNAITSDTSIYIAIGAGNIEEYRFDKMSDKSWTDIAPYEEPEEYWFENAQLADDDPLGDVLAVENVSGDQIYEFNLAEVLKQQRHDLITSARIRSKK